MALPWTKFQDFYLRLGFLKAFVASLGADRRSALNEAIERRLARPLFEPALNHPQLWSAVGAHFPPNRSSDRKKFTTVAEALLVAGNCPSWLFAITPETSYKILDWAHDVYLVGRGNQISERALVLRALMDIPAAERFFAGNATAWNPFVLSIQEKLFFLYHLCEIDQLTVLLVEGLAEADTQSLESSDAARLMCRKFFDVLKRSQPALLPRETPKYRIALELACVIADELAISEFSSQCGPGGGIRKIGRPTKRPPLGRAAQSERRTTKSADHQTIPRFEQLTDLGFFAKSGTTNANSPEEVQQRRRWRYVPTAACAAWGPRTATGSSEKFLIDGFARAAVRAYGLGTPNQTTDAFLVAKYFWTAYQRIHRPVGHTPFDSVALLAMIYAAIDGLAIEITTFHALMLRIKQRDLLPQHAFFASGNEIDKMFILLKSGFLEMLRTIDAIPGTSSE